METEDLTNWIMDLNADDTAQALVAAIVRLGQHGRDAAECIKGHIEGLGGGDRADFEEGSAQLADKLV